MVWGCCSLNKWICCLDIYICTWGPGFNFYKVTPWISCEWKRVRVWYGTITKNKTFWLSGFCTRMVRKVKGWFQGRPSVNTWVLSRWSFFSTGRISNFHRQRMVKIKSSISFKQNDGIDLVGKGSKPSSLIFGIPTYLWIRWSLKREVIKRNFLLYRWFYWEVRGRQNPSWSPLEEVKSSNHQSLFENSWPKGMELSTTNWEDWILPPLLTYPTVCRTTFILTFLVIPSWSCYLSPSLRRY